ncbi:hypothetical protein T492DRAFT_893985 [Pavlovales sp. CCMP2436]|nr:hypothetical protein T492DRAFT_893985 [Pavlovales sp. CCMP2436]
MAGLGLGDPVMLADLTRALGQWPCRAPGECALEGAVIDSVCVCTMLDFPGDGNARVLLRNTLVTGEMLREISRPQQPISSGWLRAEVLGGITAVPYAVVCLLHVAHTGGGSSSQPGHFSPLVILLRRGGETVQGDESEGAWEGAQAFLWNLSDAGRAAAAEPAAWLLAALKLPSAWPNNGTLEGQLARSPGRSSCSSQGAPLCGLLVAQSLRLVLEAVSSRRGQTGAWQAFVNKLQIADAECNGLAAGCMLAVCSEWGSEHAFPMGALAAFHVVLSGATRAVDAWAAPWVGDAQAQSGSGRKRSRGD